MHCRNCAWRFAQRQKCLPRSRRRLLASNSFGVIGGAVCDPLMPPVDRRSSRRLRRRMLRSAVALFLASCRLALGSRRLLRSRLLGRRLRLRLRCSFRHAVLLTVIDGDSNLCPRESHGTATRLLQHNKKISESNVTLTSARAWARAYVRSALERARPCRDRPHWLSTSAARTPARQDKPMKWALLCTLRGAPRRRAGGVFDLFTLPEARGERRRPGLSYSKKFLRIFPAEASRARRRRKKCANRSSAIRLRRPLESVQHEQARPPRPRADALTVRASPLGSR